MSAEEVKSLKSAPRRRESAMYATFHRLKSLKFSPRKRGSAILRAGAPLAAFRRFCALAPNAPRCNGRANAREKSTTIAQIVSKDRLGCMEHLLSSPGFPGHEANIMESRSEFEGAEGVLDDATNGVRHANGFQQQYDSFMFHLGRSLH